MHQFLFFGNFTLPKDITLFSSAEIAQWLERHSPILATWVQIRNIKL